MYNFPVRTEGDPVLKHIFPSMQRDVQRIIETARKIDKIKRIIVFGSTVTMNCGIGSDLDFAADVPDVHDEDEFLATVRPLRRAVQVNTDIIHYNTIRNVLLKDEIDQKGVVVYVNNNGLC